MENDIILHEMFKKTNLTPASTMIDSCNAFDMKEIFPPLLLSMVVCEPTTFWLKSPVIPCNAYSTKNSAYLRLWSVQEVSVKGRHVLCYPLCFNDYFECRGSVQGWFRSNIFC
jgi:hypothetical protein